MLRLIEINTALNSELNLKRLLTLILDSVIELTRAERGFIITRREARTTVTASIPTAIIQAKPANKDITTVMFISTPYKNLSGETFTCVALYP